MYLEKKFWVARILGEACALSLTCYGYFSLAGLTYWQQIKGTSAIVFMRRRDLSGSASLADRFNWRSGDGSGGLDRHNEVVIDLNDFYYLLLTADQLLASFGVCNF